MWDLFIGTPFHLHYGVRQVIACCHLIFAIYVDYLITELRITGYGLHTGNMFMGAILYADDFVLLVCKCFVLQKLINISVKYGL